MKLERARDLDERIKEVVERLEMTHIKPDQVVAFRSTGATARARARIYAMPEFGRKLWRLSPIPVLSF